MGRYYKPGVTTEVPLHGSGITERDRLLSRFAREADISNSDVELIVSGQADQVSNQKNVAAFERAVARSFTFGDKTPIENFAEALESADNVEVLDM